MTTTVEYKNGVTDTWYVNKFETVRGAVLFQRSLEEDDIEWRIAPNETEIPDE